MRGYRLSRKAQISTTSGTAAETQHGQRKIPNQQGLGEDCTSSNEEERGTPYQTATEVKLQPVERSLRYV